MDSINLFGSEDVYRAGSAMQNAASTMQSAAASIDFSLHRHRMFLDDWLMRFEEVFKTKEDN